MQTNLCRVQQAAGGRENLPDINYKLAHINKYIAVLILLGLHSLASERLASSDILMTGVPIIQAIMTSTLYTGLKRVLHFSGKLTSGRQG